ncbi:MAG: TonB-dependent receptor [Prolixibacteraceae bacterium]|nr:TonB-dependent receptor [Prolixibacteraceae bacterium]
MLKHLFLFLLLISFIDALLAQPPQIFKGKVVSKKNSEPVSFATIHMKEADLWIISDDNGLFTTNINNLPSVTLEVQCLGFEAYSSILQPSDFRDKELVVRLTPTSFAMEEITVLAKRSGGITTSSTLGNAAIQHVQPTSLADVMQLLPGNISSNPDLSTAQKISIREIGEDSNSAMGTAILVDGSPVSNDANLQTFSTSKTSDNFSTVAGSGIDLRQISTDNIESIEVIKGIPSVAYGDLTSGAVIVKTKAGHTPLEVKLKTDPKIKQIAIGKGIKLKAARSSVNFNFDYLQSFSDLRSKYEGFNRLTADIGFSKVFNPQKLPLSLNVKMSYFETIDEEKTDPDAMVAGENVVSQDRGIRLNSFGKWSPRLKLLTNLDYSLSFSLTHQISKEELYRTTASGLQVISVSLTEGENTGIFLPAEQFTHYTIDGKPFTISFQLTANKFSNFHNGNTNKVLYGLEYRLNANYGDGQVYDIWNPPFINSYSSRPRKYKDIPALQNLSVFLEDKLFLTLGKTHLDMQAGIRVNNFQMDGLFDSELGFYAEPRFNAQYRFLSQKNNKLFDKLSINFGIGKTYKSPSLIFLYPDKAYFDLSSLNYYVGDPSLNLSIVDTRIYETGNKNLKPSENLKIEAGIDFKFKNISGNITCFNEQLTNGFGFGREYLFLPYFRYQTSSVVPGTKPNPLELPKVQVVAVEDFQKPLNNQKIEKSGVEFSLDLGKVKILQTSFTLDGAWLKTKQTSSILPVQFQPSSASAVVYPYIGIYPAGESKISERFNTNLRMVTQIPRLRLLLSATTQLIWYDKYYYPLYDEAPMHLLYQDGSTRPFTPAMRNDPNYIRFVVNRSDKYYKTEIMPPLLLVNFRLSKELNDKMKFSFYVNNFTNSRPMYEYKRSGTFVRRNPEIYFGAELKLTL